MSSKNYRDLLVWQRAMVFVEAVYQATANFPESEKFGLVSQMRRSAVSVPCNIAEGQGRGGVNEFVRFLRVAYGSLRELETQWIIAGRLGYAKEVEVTAAIEASEEIGRMLNGLIRSLQNQAPQ